MRSWNTHIKIKQIILISFISVLFLSCEKEKEVKEVIVASVGESRLTENELNKFLGNKSGIAKYRDEYIRQWLETELLSRIAEEKKLLSDDNYFNIIDNSSKELAADIVIRDFLSTQKINYSERQLKQFFTANKEDYIFYEDAYLINLVGFSDELSAIAFRNQALSDNWSSAIELFSNDTTMLINQEKKIYKQHEIQSKLLMRVLRKLYKYEISLVINTELNSFVIVQQLDKISKNTVPRFDYVFDEVLSAYMIQEQRKKTKNFVDSLMTQQSVKIY